MSQEGTETLVAEEETHRFPCDSCGADMRFDPATGDLLCDHCGNVVHMDRADPPRRTRPVTELDFRAALATPEAGGLVETQSLRIAQCENCGARIEFDAAEHAAECPFCASPIVVGTGEERQIKPQGVVPFHLDEETARKALADWLGRLWFAPGGLQQYARKGRRLQGIYVPYWTFDADTRSSYRGERGTVYYETRTVMRDGKRVQKRVQKVRWRPKSGQVARFFDDVLVLASRALPKRFTDALQPWDLSALEPYRPEYLAGFRAEAYTVPLEEGFAEARAHMDAVIRRDVRFDIGGDRQRIHQIDTTISDVTFKHILLPVWMAAYRFRGRSYRFVVNGQTGTVKGERPWSWIKIGLALLLGAILAAGLGYMAAMNEAGAFQ